MQSVTPREREVLRLRFEEDLTQAEIGERIGVSQMQVSRLIRQSVARLRASPPRARGRRSGLARSGAHGLGAKTPRRWVAAQRARPTTPPTRLSAGASRSSSASRSRSIANPTAAETAVSSRLDLSLGLLVVEQKQHARVARRRRRPARRTRAARRDPERRRRRGLQPRRLRVAQHAPERGVRRDRDHPGRATRGATRRRAAR